jgi:hypothetical protein
MNQSNSGARRPPAFALVTLIAMGAAGTLAALWSAPAAKAGFQVDGHYVPPGGDSGQIFAHLNVYGSNDASQPTSTITMAGCTIDIYITDGNSEAAPEGATRGTVRSHVSSGSGPYCRDSTRIDMLVSDVGGGNLTYSFGDIDNGGQWIFGPAPNPGT